MSTPHTVFPRDVIFQKHSKNLSEIKRSMVQIELAHKSAIRTGDDALESTFRRIHHLHIGIYAEAFLRKIIRNPLGFNDVERGVIWGARSQDLRWKKAVDLAVRRHYGVLLHQDLSQVLAQETQDQIYAVQSLLENELKPTITDRNKLAHGQWVWQLKSGKEDEFLTGSNTYDYNYAALRSRYVTLGKIGQLVELLVQSQPAFERDFASLIEAIDVQRAALDGSGHEALRRQLRKYVDASAS